MGDIPWDRALALDVVVAGYRTLVRKHHPDTGGSHAAMLTLTATKDALTRLIEDGAPDFDVAPEPAPKPKAYEPPPRPAGMMLYTDGWWCVPQCAVVATTEKAVLIDQEDTERPFWMPKSQLAEVANECWEEGDTGLLVFTAWIARQKGWI